MASSSLPPSLERLSLSFPSPQFPSLTPEMEDGEYSSWSELPTELTSSILQRLGAIEVLENAQKVCTSWRRVSKDPAMWRKIVMHNVEDLGYNLDIMYRHAVDRSQGGLVEIEIWDFGTDSLVNYIAYSSGNLRSLKLVKCYLVTDEGFTEALVKLPLFEELEVSYGSLSRESLKSVAHDDDALAIAATMNGLRHLQLFGNNLTDDGLNAILDNCPNLEHLDLLQCFNVNIVGDLENRCSESIKVLRRPNDSIHDYPYDASVIEMYSFEYEFPDDVDQPDVEILDFPEFDLTDDLQSFLYSGLYDER
ncbi:hypothetical protein Bca4012_003269 [Brassica carinata]